jgi:hypothetical protein
MSPEEAIERIAQSTAQAGMNPARTLLQGSEVLVARTSQFRLRWMATKLHTFLVASIFPAGTATTDRLDTLIELAARYAKANKGGLPVGFQTGVAVLVVAVTEHADPAAHQWASTSHKRKFATLPFPVMADTTTGQVTRPEKMLLGGIYKAYLQGLADQHVAAPLRPGPGPGIAAG